MEILNKKDKLEYLDQLIKQERTGISVEKIKLRSVFRLIDTLRCLGAPIDQDKFRETYYYKKEGRIVLGFQSNVDLKKIKGGRKVKTNRIWQSRKLPL